MYYLITHTFRDAHLELGWHGQKLLLLKKIFWPQLEMIIFLALHVMPQYSIIKHIKIHLETWWATLTEVRLLNWSHAANYTYLSIWGSMCYVICDMTCDIWHDVICDMAFDVTCHDMKYDKTCDMTWHVTWHGMTKHDTTWHDITYLELLVSFITGRGIQILSILQRCVSRFRQILIIKNMLKWFR